MHDQTHPCTCWKTGEQEQSDPALREPTHKGVNLELKRGNDTFNPPKHKMNDTSFTSTTT